MPCTWPRVGHQLAGFGAGSYGGVWARVMELGSRSLGSDRWMERVMYFCAKRGAVPTVVSNWDQPMLPVVSSAVSRNCTEPQACLFGAA